MNTYVYICICIYLLYVFTYIEYNDNFQGVGVEGHARHTLSSQGAAPLRLEPVKREPKNEAKVKAEVAGLPQLDPQNIRNDGSMVYAH